MGEAPWLYFEVGEARLAIAASFVEEILEIGVVTPVPLAPPSIGGVMNLRGEALPLLDLSVFFELAGQAEPRTVLSCRTRAFRVGLLCHRARGIRRISPGQTTPPQLARPTRLLELAHAEMEDPDGTRVLLDIEALLEAACVRG